MRRDSNLSLSLSLCMIKPNINDNETFFKTTSVTLLSTFVNNETNTKTAYFYAKTKGFCIKDTKILWYFFSVCSIIDRCGNECHT